MIHPTDQTATGDARSTDGFRKMRVLVACEFSGTVRDAFAGAGWEAWSCDLLPSERPGKHLQGDAIEVIRDAGPWDILIAHPPAHTLPSAVRDGSRANA